MHVALIGSAEMLNSKLDRKPMKIRELEGAQQP